MSTTPAFDLALFVPPPANINDGVLVDTLGPPFTTKFKPVVVGSKPGVTVGSSMPAATAPNQILASGAGPAFAWSLVTNPAASASVPAPTGANHVLLSDATPAWQETPLSSMLLTGGAVMQATGGIFATVANLAFTATATLTKRIDGADPAMSLIDNFTLDCGTF